MIDCLVDLMFISFVFRKFDPVDGWAAREDAIAASEKLNALIEKGVQEVLYPPAEPVDRFASPFGVITNLYFTRGFFNTFSVCSKNLLLVTTWENLRPEHSWNDSQKPMTRLGNFDTLPTIKISDNSWTH